MENKHLANFAAKYPEDVANKGFVPVPRCIFTCMPELDLTPAEVVVLGNILERCWKAGDKSWQKVDTIGGNIGRNNSSTRRITKSLAKKGFIKKERQFNSSVLYDPSPLGNKIAKHLPYCRHVKKSAQPRSKISEGGRSKISDYIEPVLHRTTYLEPNINSRSVINDDYDQLLNDLESNFGKCFAGGRHSWREYEKEREDGTYYYFICIKEGCGRQFHKKSEKPWAAEYPHVNSD